ncbi:antiviral reverse transcriptase Drt3a [Aeromonas veronii]
MLKQDFSINSLLKITERNEIIKFSLGRNADDYKEALVAISEEISAPSFHIKNVLTKKIKDKNLFFTEIASEHYALKKITRDLKRLYKIQFSNRDDIAEQVLKVIETSAPYSIVRIDIKSFYESISFENVLIKQSNDKLLSAKSILIIKKLYDNLATLGLPRGLSISPVLSEIFMRDFDRKVREIKGVYYYARYVDDIIIVSFDSNEHIYKELMSTVKSFNLNINEKLYKNDIGIANNVQTSIQAKFDYLGYKYIITNNMFLFKRTVNIELADDKRRKIKTRIIHSLIDRVYGDGNSTAKSTLLINRLKFLSSNYPISSSNKKNTDGILKGGIFYSNRLVNNIGIFNEFNTFLARAINSKRNNFWGRAMRMIPSTEKREIINTVCFVQGFKDKIYLELSESDMKEIKQCWKHKNHKGKKR